MSLETRRRGGVPSRKTSVSEKIAVLKHGAALRGSEIIAAGEDVAKNQRAVFVARHRPLPIAEEKINAVVVQFAIRFVLYEFGSGIGVDAIDRVLRSASLRGCLRNQRRNEGT